MEFFQRKIVIIPLIVITVIATSIIFYSNSWRFFGFKHCENPSYIRIDSAEITGNKLIVSGYGGGLPQSFVHYYFAGYKTKRKGSTIYLGIKIKTGRYFVPKSGSKFDISIPIDDDVKEVILTNEVNEVLIFNR